MLTKQQLLESLRNRKSRSGIVTADRYFREVEGCFEGGFCPTNVVGSGQSEESWRKALTEAESKLTYCNDESRIIRKSVKSRNVEGGILQFDAIVTTPLRDRDGDTLKSQGAMLDPKAPLLWQHIWMQPTGALVRTLKQTDSELRARFVVADTPLGRDTAALIKVGALRISHGFEPIEFDIHEDEKGFIFHKFNIFEVSTVSIPSNVQAEILEVVEKDLKSPLVIGWTKSLEKRLPATASISGTIGGAGSFTISGTVCGCGGSKASKQLTLPAPERESVYDPPPATMKKEFDVERQHVEAATIEYDWISRFCSCEVKNLVNFDSGCSPAWMGSFLTGLKHELKSSEQVDARRLTYNGKETPLEYEVIQLNSKLSDHFLVDGISFRKMANGTCFAVKYVRHWSGETVSIFSSRKDHEQISGILSRAWAWARENNFLKGEAFSISGEFLPPTGEAWDDVFLEEKNIIEVRRVVDLLNTKGIECPNRGMVMMGPPGTGKTLSGRLMRNYSKGTFIWVGGKDAYYWGGTSAVLEAFQLAKDLGPAIIFLEDIDGSFNDRTIDVLKGEMDGIGRSKGIVTVLTTNFPERLPKALLDRPGRFHDVLEFELPSKDIRAKMIAKWLPDLSATVRDQTATATDGYSGAHVYELCKYALSIQESDDLEVDAAVVKAMTKLAEQRELINRTLLQQYHAGGRHRDAEVPRVKSRAITKHIGGRSAPIGLEDLTREFLGSVTGNIDAMRKAHQFLSLQIAAHDERAEAREAEAFLSQFN